MEGTPLSLEGKGITEEVRLEGMGGSGFILVAGVRAMKEGEARGFEVEGEKEEWAETLAVQVVGEESTGLVVVRVGGAMMSDFGMEGEESLEGEEVVVVVVVVVLETVELGSDLEWCFEKWGLGDEWRWELV